VARQKTGRQAKRSRQERRDTGGRKEKWSCMNTRVDYGQLAAKLDYEALNKKLEELSQREAPKKRKTVVDALEPLRERLLALHRKGWSSGQLVEELKAAGVPVSPARFRECLSQWAGNGKKTGKSRNNHRNARNDTNARPTTPASQVTPTKSAFAAGQTGFRVKDL
jgi:hypothetical protein